MHIYYEQKCPYCGEKNTHKINIDSFISATNCSYYKVQNTITNDEGETRGLTQVKTLDKCSKCKKDYVLILDLKVDITSKSGKITVE